ncbi:MAG TPA: protein kinase [Polyangiaceae bacterium]|nr:protein kinase [Polyangiaceae bacterium]
MNSRSLRSLDIAARSLLESQAASGTLASVIAEGALAHHFSGLFQYAASRIGTGPALAALERLEQEFENEPALDGEAGSFGVGARLYRRLRITLRSEPTVALAPDAPEWWTPPERSLAACLIELRCKLDADQAEVLELCFARGLPVPDAAYVLELAPDATERCLTAALAVVDQTLRSEVRSGRPRELSLLQAFALDPRYVQAPRRVPRKAMLGVGDVIQQRYQIEEALGAGAFADVYRARDLEVTDHVVALKILRRPAADAHATRAALRELQLIASVFHPSIVQLKDHGWHLGHLWFVMPLYRGETLRERLRRGPLKRAEARQVFEPLAEALATMHRAGVRHQDIKPENVFLANIDPESDSHPSSSGARILPVLLDLGVAAKDAELVLAGTPAFFAPEVAARFAGVPDPPPVGPKSDVFSLALTLREALDPSPTASLATGAVDAFVTFRAGHGASPPRRAELSDLRGCFETWLHLSPDVRPSAEEFRNQLGALTRPAERRARRLELMRWAVPIAFTVLVLFVAVVFVLSREAKLQRIDADTERARAERARDRAASMHASLEEEEARRRKLESDISRLEGAYQNSRMTREQLAARLANAEGETSALLDRQQLQQSRLRQQSEEVRQLRELGARLVGETESLRRRRDELASELDRTKAALDLERARHAETAARTETVTLQLRAAEVVLEEARARNRELETHLNQAPSKPMSPKD